MALANKKKLANSKGTIGICVVQFDCDNAYPAGVGGGYPLDFSPYGCKDPYFVTFQNTFGYEAQYDKVNKVVRFYGTATATAITSATEVGNGADLSALVGVRGIAFYDR
jgi:hypothetical protein